VARPLFFLGGNRARMRKKAAEREKAPKDCRDCIRWKQIREKVRVARLLELAIGKMEARLKDDDFKPSIGDYVKLLQLEQELSQDETKEIRVTWVEPTAASKPEKSE
jgi:hypothetical protein